MAGFHMHLGPLSWVLLATLWGQSVLAADTSARYELIDLGPVLGGSAIAWDINRQGHVVGEAVNEELGSHAIFWDGCQVRALSGFVGRVYSTTISSAYAINDQDRIAGQANTPADFVPTLWSSPGQSPPQELSRLYHTSGLVSAINAQGIMVGSLFARNGPDNIAPVQWHPDGRTEALHAPNGGMAFDLNDAGAVVGYFRFMSTDPQTGSWGLAQAPALWRDTQQLTALPIPPGASGTGNALAINNLGQVVGWVRSKDGHEQAALWQDGRVVSLGALGHGRHSVASHISDRGVIVGRGTSPDLLLEPTQRQSALVWFGRMGPFDLNGLIDARWRQQGVTLTSAHKVTEREWILGMAWHAHAWRMQPFLLRPVADKDRPFCLD